MRRDPALVILRHLLRSARVSTLVWGSAFGLVVYSSSATYTSAYPTQRQRLALSASLSSNIGLQALFGATRRLETIGGFAAWRSLGLLTIVGAIWGVLTGARLLRGEEDSGRWELMAAGPLSRRRCAGAGVLTAVLLWVGLFALTAVGALLGAAQTHVRAGAMLFLALVACLPALVFLGVGLLAGQLAPNRSSAARVGGAVFGACYVIRMVSIAPGTGWVHSVMQWVTPLGWIDSSHPVTGSRWLPLLAVAVLLVALLSAVLAVAARRDLGSAAIGRVAGRRSRMMLLGSPVTSTLRITASRWTGWFAGSIALCLVLGLVSKSVGRQADSSRMVGHLLHQLGARPHGAATFLGLAMSMVACLVGLAAASGTASMCEEELTGRASTILAQPVSRTRWYLSRAMVDAGAVLALAAMIGALLAVVGSVAALGVGITSLLAAGLNLAPLALTVLGLGLLAQALAPRAAAGVGYVVIGWSFLVEFVGAAVSAPRWVLDLSLLHHVALAPAAAPRWGTNAVLIAVGLLSAAVGVAAFGRRDVAAA